MDHVPRRFGPHCWRSVKKWSLIPPLVLRFFPTTMLATTVVTMSSMLAAGVSGCGEEGADSDEQLRALLLHEDAVELGAPTEERLVAVSRLEALHLADPALRAVRDTCVRGHRELLSGEEAQAEAQGVLESLSQVEQRELPGERRREIEAAIARSSQAIERAGPLLRDCREAIDGFELDLARR